MQFMLFITSPALVPNHEDVVILRDFIHPFIITMQYTYKIICTKNAYYSPFFHQPIAIPPNTVPKSRFSAAAIT